MYIDLIPQLQSTTECASFIPDCEKPLSCPITQLTGNALDTKEEGNAEDQADSGSAGENGEKPLLHDISGM